MLERSRRWLEGANREMEAGNYDNAVYMFQMALETVTKALLTYFGIDFPKERDVSEPLRLLSTRAETPAWLRNELPSMADTIEELARVRGLASYGYEHGLSLQDFAEKGHEYKEKVSTAFQSCERFLNRTKEDRAKSKIE